MVTLIYLCLRPSCLGNLYYIEQFVLYVVDIKLLKLAFTTLFWHSLMYLRYFSRKRSLSHYCFGFLWCILCLYCGYTETSTAARRTVPNLGWFLRRKKLFTFARNAFSLINSLHLEKIVGPPTLLNTWVEKSEIDFITRALEIFSDQFSILRLMFWELRRHIGLWKLSQIQCFSAHYVN